MLGHVSLVDAAECAAAGARPRKPDERAHARLYANVQAWLCQARGVYEPSPGKPLDLLDALATGSEAHDVRVQAEALAWFHLSDLG